MSLNSRKVQYVNDLVFPYIYAFFLVAISLCQLFSFDDLLNIFGGFNLFAGLSYKLAAALVVILQTLALPFLLNLDLTPVFRKISLACSVLVPVIWIVLSLCLITVGFSGNLGIFGSLIKVSPIRGLMLWFIVLVLALICTVKFKSKK